ncbi:MAG TPA: glycosyltransferase [Patescibacteria group bacterium]|nr:glycosyltransferase [Patescibacteria group bacterium]
MDAPYFSIIIPTLNEERFLPKLLKDLQKQKEKSFETIVIDGHSSDKTLELAQDFSLPIYVHSVTKRNVSFQRNWGARHARGRYLIFLDADSRINMYFIGNCFKAMRSNKSLIFIPLFHVSKKYYQDSIIFSLANFFIEVSQNFGRPISAGGSMIFEKEYFHFLGGFNEKLFFSEDYEIVSRARKYGVCAYVLKNVKITFSMRRFKKEGHFNVFKKYALAWLYHFSNNSGGIYKKIFDYKMGGSNYPLLEKKLKVKKISHYFDELKHQLTLFINEFNE